MIILATCIAFGSALRLAVSATVLHSGAVAGLMFVTNDTVILCHIYGSLHMSAQLVHTSHIHSPMVPLLQH